MSQVDDLTNVGPAPTLVPSRTEDESDVSGAGEVKPRIASRNGKSKNKREPKRLTNLVFPLLACIGLGGIMLGGYKFFDAARRHVGEQDRFRIATQEIEISPPPVWIRCNLVAEVQRIGDLPPALNTLEPNLAERLRDAFALHPWVRNVIEVRVIHPATIRVKLDYREPVAVVRTGKSLEAVDREGVLLSATELPDPLLYLAVTGVRSTPTGPVGTQWNDPAVLAAVATADAISPHHRTLGISTIDVGGIRVGSGATQGSIFILTDQGTRVKWGRPPNVDYPGEIPVQDKLDRMLKYVAENESLDKPSGPYDIDITHWQEISIRPRSSTPSKSR